MQAYPPYIKYSSSIGSTDSFFKINIESLFLEGDDKAFSHFESLCRKTLLDTETQNLQFAYHDIEGDLILFHSPEAFLIALGECPKDSLKVFVHESDKSISLNSNGSHSEVEKSIATLRDEVSSLRIASQKSHQCTSLLDNQSTLRPPPGLWDFSNKESISKPTRTVLEPSMAYLWGKDCMEEADRIAFFGSAAAAVFDLSTIKAGRYRATIEVSNCHVVDNVCYAGVLEGNYQDFQSTLQEQSNDGLYQLTLPVSPRSRNASTATNKMVVPSLEIKGQSKQGPISGEKFVLTGSNMSFNLVSVTLEESWPCEEVKGLKDEWAGLMNGVDHTQDSGPKFVVEGSEMNFDSFVDEFLDSKLVPSEHIAGEATQQGLRQRHVYTKMDMLRFQKHPTCTDRASSLPSHYPIIEVSSRRERKQVELEVLPSRRNKRR